MEVQLIRDLSWLHNAIQAKEVMLNSNKLNNLMFSSQNYTSFDFLNMYYIYTKIKDKQLNSREMMKKERKGP